MEIEKLINICEKKRRIIGVAERWAALLQMQKMFWMKPPPP